MTLVAKPPTRLLKSKFRIQIDDIGDLRATIVTDLKRTFNIVDTEEGGAQTTADMTVNGYKFEPITVERPLTDDDALADWVDNYARGIQDKRNGAVYALDTQGRDVYRWDLEELVVADYTEFQGDAKAKDGTDASMMERITLRYRERGKRVKVQ